MIKKILPLVLSISFIYGISLFVPNTSVYANDFQSQQESLLKLNGEIENLSNEVDTFNKEIEEKTKLISKYEKEIKPLEEKYKEYDKILKENAKILQTNGQDLSTLELILSGKNFTEIISTWNNTKTIMNSQAEIVSNMKDLKEDLKIKKDNLEKETKSLKEAEEKSSQKLADFATGKEELLIKLAVFDRNYASELKEMRKNNDTVAKALKEANGNDTSIISDSFEYLDIPYVWGGTSPSPGFDCSGLLVYLYNQHGISLPRTSQSQSMLGTHVELNDLIPGDLVFWGGVGSAYHVGLYLGDGLYIHAPTVGDVVKIGDINSFSPSFGRRL